MIGLIVSLILIFIARWFWTRFDKPSAAQIERDESIKQSKKEMKMWRAVEIQMAEEQAMLEQKAAHDAKKAEQRARAVPPPVSKVNDAFAALQVDLPPPAFSENSDVLLVEEPVEVRQDEGVKQVEDVPPAPDLELLILQKQGVSSRAEDLWSKEVASLENAEMTKGRTDAVEEE